MGGGGYCKSEGLGNQGLGVPKVWGFVFRSGLGWGFDLK